MDTFYLTYEEIFGLVKFLNYKCKTFEYQSGNNLKREETIEKYILYAHVAATISDKRDVETIQYEDNNIKLGQNDKLSTLKFLQQNTITFSCEFHADDITAKLNIAIEINKKEHVNITTKLINKPKELAEKQSVAPTEESNKTTKDEENTFLNISRQRGSKSVTTVCKDKHAKSNTRNMALKLLRAVCKQDLNSTTDETESSVSRSLGLVLAETLSQIDVTEIFPTVTWASGHPLIPAKVRITYESTDTNAFIRRLQTFLRGDNGRSTTWPDDIDVRPESLATAGFSYTGNGYEVECLTCGYITDVSTWTESEDHDETAMFEHNRTSTFCSFLSTYYSGYEHNRNETRNATYDLEVNKQEQREGHNNRSQINNFNVNSKTESIVLPILTTHTVNDLAMSFTVHVEHNDKSYTESQSNVFNHDVDIDFKQSKNFATQRELGDSKHSKTDFCIDDKFLLVLEYILAETIARVWFLLKKQKNFGEEIFKRSDKRLCNKTTKKRQHM